MAPVIWSALIAVASEPTTRKLRLLTDGIFSTIAPGLDKILELAVAADTTEVIPGAT
jgi:hypothetical protein